jgi:hypothetical protein
MLFHNRCLGTIAYLGGIPSLLEEFVWSFTQMVQYNTEALCGPGEYIHYDHSKISFHAAARNHLAEQMRGDWLLMLDTDHSFEPDICARMVDRMNVYGTDVLTGLYQYRHHPHSPVLYMKCGDLFSPLASWRPVGDAMDLFCVDSAGAGCLLVKRKVFDRIRAELKESPFDIIHPLGEDHSFGKRLGKLDIKMYCDPRIECNHLAVRAISLKDYDRSAIGESMGEEVQTPAIRLV